MIWMVFGSGCYKAEQVRNMVENYFNMIFEERFSSFFDGGNYFVCRDRANPHGDVVTIRSNFDEGEPLYRGDGEYKTVVEVECYGNSRTWTSGLQALGFTQLQMEIFDQQ